MLEGSVPTSVGWGVFIGLVTFFSPCAYPLLPGYAGYYASQADGEVTLGGSVLRGIVAAGGLVLTLGVLLGGGLAVGETLVSRMVYPGAIVGVVLVVAGIAVLARVRLGRVVPLPRRRASVTGFGIFGAGYAVSSVGCIVPVFLAYVAILTELSATGTAVSVSSYLVSVGGLMIAFTVAAGTGIGLGLERSVPVGLVKRVAGLVLVVAGLGQLYLVLVVL